MHGIGSLYIDVRYGASLFQNGPYVQFQHTHRMPHLDVCNRLGVVDVSVFFDIMEPIHVVRLAGIDTEPFVRLHVRVVRIISICVDTVLSKPYLTVLVQIPFGTVGYRLLVIQQICLVHVLV